MIVLQITITVFIAAILLRLFRQRRNNRLSLGSFLVWFFLWLLVLIVFWQPDVSTYLAHILGIGRGADLVIYLAIIAIFYVLFRISIKINKIDSDITKLVRRDALRADEDEK
jgi:hypothetical protein